MRAEYLRHEYTWSGQCISGNKLGWGIIASSTPKDKNNLREMEKIASIARPDREGKIPVEELFYSPAAGFIKTVTVPAEAGEDNRENKLVKMYQPKRPAMDPAVYLAPGGAWEDQAEKGYLSEIIVEGYALPPEHILIEYHLYDRLPEFLKVVFWRLFESPGGLNVAAPSWREEEFAENAGKLMYALHSLLPEFLRKKAGYCSFARQMPEGTAVVFSKEPIGENYFNLDTFERSAKLKENDPLEEYFYYHLAEWYVKDRSVYQEYLGLVSDYVQKSQPGGMELGKLRWLFYNFARNHGKEMLDRRYLAANLPELFYWCSREEEFCEIVREIQESLHGAEWDSEDELRYIHVLLDGVASRSKAYVSGELEWILQRVYDRDPREAMTYFALIREKNPDIYTGVVCDTCDRENSCGGEIWKQYMGSLGGIEKFLSVIKPQSLTPDAKGHMIRRGIELLNENIFNAGNYKVFDRVMHRLERQDQWGRILKDFVLQLEDKAQVLTDSQLETSCYVEAMLQKYEPEACAGLLLAEKERRLIPEKELDIMPEESEGEPDGGSEDVSWETPEENKGSFIDFMMLVSPQGFLTGCILYLANHSLLIGHWKIAVGMLGMWILFTLNFSYTMLCHKEGHPLWKCIGMSIVEGCLIEIAAFMLFSQKIRVYYFIVLGVFAVLIQMGNIIRKKK